MTIANPGRLMMAGNVLVAGLLLGGGLLIANSAKQSPESTTSTTSTTSPAEQVPVMPYASDGATWSPEEPPPMEKATESAELPVRSLSIRAETGLGSINVSVEETP